jgi:formylglycine-generating enzyme required for sulfatase activity
MKPPRNLLFFFVGVFFLSVVPMKSFAKEVNIYSQMVKLALVPGGKYEIGGAGRYNKRFTVWPRKVINFQPFYVMESQVEQQLWDLCVKEGPCQRQSWHNLASKNSPAGGPSWDNITTQFVPWINSVTSQQFRLMTESEWEYIVGSSSDGSDYYSWGDKVGTNNAACRGCGSQWDARFPAPSKSFKPNKYGIYDLQGNLSEYLEDCQNPNYDNMPEDGSAQLSGVCSMRMIRGGSYMSDPDYLKRFYRSVAWSKVESAYIGFRLALDD